MVLTLKEYQNNVDEDFNISKANVLEFQKNLPILHNKYLRYYYTESDNYSKAKIKLDKLYREIYYEYKENYKYSLNNAECKWHTETDDRYCELYYKVSVLKRKVEYLEKIIKPIPFYTRAVSNIIDLIRFENGA